MTYNGGAICPGGLMDKVAVSGAVDAGSIPARDAKASGRTHLCPSAFFIADRQTAETLNQPVR